MALIDTVVMCAFSQDLFVSVSVWGTCHVSFSAAYSHSVGIRSCKAGICVRRKPFYKTREIAELRGTCSKTRKLSCRTMESDPSHWCTASADIRRTCMVIKQYGGNGNYRLNSKNR